MNEHLSPVAKQAIDRAGLTVYFRELAERLAPLYLKDEQAVAHLCDEVLDRSGGLLGLVRAEARGKHS